MQRRQELYLLSTNNSQQNNWIHFIYKIHVKTKNRNIFGNSCSPLSREM